MMRPALLMSLLIPGLLAATAEILQDADLPVGALAADEECAVGADGCALNALQRKAQKAVADEEIVAEVSAATADQPSESNTAEESEAFVEPDEFDAEEPEAFVELEDSEADQQEGESVEEEQEAESAEEEQEGESAEEQDMKDESSGRRRSPRYNNKCCKCRDGTIAWSHSGTCSPCHGQIKKMKNPQPSCTQGSPQWPSHAQNWPRHCANECAQLFKNSGGHHGGGSCSKETSGTCKIWSCKKSRGHTQCVSGKCLCKPGYCARNGVCM